MLYRLCLTASLIVVPALAAQNRTDARIAIARARITARDFRAADTELATALDSAAYLMDSVHVFVWRGILEYLQGSDSVARQSFRSALMLYPALRVNNLDQVAPGLDAVFQSEFRGRHIYSGSELDEQAAWRSGSPLVYPADLRRRKVAGQAVLTAVVDTLGHVEEPSIRVIDVPDSGFLEPLRRMMLGATFTPGRLKGQVVRTRVDLKFTLTPPPPRSPTALVGAARDQLRAHRADSALALTEEALDGANQPTPGERVYAELVRGLALRATHRDSLAEQSFTTGLAGYHDLTAQGVDLAPFLKRLADSIRISRRGTPARINHKAAREIIRQPITFAAIDALTRTAIVVEHDQSDTAPPASSCTNGSSSTEFPSRTETTQFVREGDGAYASRGHPDLCAGLQWQ